MMKQTNPSHDKGNVAAAVIAWWEENRPLGWAEEDHVAQATVNCETDAEQALARLAAQLVRATPPSPSTAPEGTVTDYVTPADERAAFEAWVTCLAPGHPLARNPNGRYSADCNEWAWDGWKARAALASRPAEVDDEGLPPLPATRKIGQNHLGFIYGYDAEQYRQGQRDAVAADRARRKAGGGEK